MANVTSLDILVRTIADSSGVKFTDEQLAKLKGTIKDYTESTARSDDGQKKFSSSAKETGKTLGELKEIGRGGREVIEGLSRANEGGAQSFFGIAAATRGFIGLVRASVGPAGPIGLLVAGVAVLAGSLIALATRITTVTHSQKDFSVAVDESTDAMRQLDAQKLSSVDKAIKESTNLAERYYDALKKTLELEGQQARANADVEIAKINADKTLSESEKLVRTAAVNQRFNLSDRSRHDETQTVELNSAQYAADARATDAAFARTKLGSQQAVVTRIRRADAAREDRIRELENILRPEEPDASDLPAPEFADDRIRLLKYSTPRTAGREEVTKLAEELRQLLTARGLANSDDGKGRLAIEQKRLDDARAQVQRAEQAEADAKEKAAKLAQDIELERKASPALRAAQDAKTTIDLRGAIYDARGTDIANLDSRAVDSELRTLPTGLDVAPQQRDAIKQRAVQIHQEALTSAGVQLGEEIGGALAQAIGEFASGVRESTLAQIAKETNDLRRDLTGRMDSALKASKNLGQ